jgi:hypothetical protein
MHTWALSNTSSKTSSLFLRFFKPGIKHHLENNTTCRSDYYSHSFGTRYYHTSSPALKQHQAFKSIMVQQSEICLRCKQRVKRKDSQFCSDRCTQIAAKSAPMLIRVPKGHVMYNNGGSFTVEIWPNPDEKYYIIVKKSFKNSWHDKKKLPTIVSISLITWTAQQRKSFETYRSVVFWHMMRLNSSLIPCFLGIKWQKNPNLRTKKWSGSAPNVVHVIWAKARSRSLANVTHAGYAKQYARRSKLASSTSRTQWRAAQSKAF